MGDLSGPEALVADAAQADSAGGEDGRLGRRMQSARERVMERLDSPQPDVSTEELQRAVESLARRVEATSSGHRAKDRDYDRGADRGADRGYDRDAGRNYDRAQHRSDERPAAAPSGSEDFDDILDRDDPRRGAGPDSRHEPRREAGYEARPAVGRDLPPDARFETRPDMRPDTRPDMRQESLGVLDRLEARLDSLSERVEPSKGVRAVAADGADPAARTDMSRQFLALEQRIDALREVAEANSVSVVREDLSRLGRQVDNLAHDRGDTNEAIDTVSAQLERLHLTFRDRGEPESAALVAIEQRLAGLTEQVGQFELAPAALDAVERGYAHILERMVKIERMAEDAVPPEDLWARIEAIRSQIERLPSRDSVSAMENRLLELADRIDAAAASNQGDNALVRLEGQLEKIAYSLAEIGVRKDAEGDDLSRRLGDVLKRLDRMEAEGKAIDFTPIEVRLSDIAARLDTRLRGPTDRAVAAIEKRLEGLARAFDDQLDLAAAGLVPLERKLDGLTGLIRDVELTGRGPDMGVFEQRLDDLQARLGEIGIEVRRSGGPEMQRRLDELAIRLDAFQVGETHIDMQPVAERLDHLAEQINMQPVAERLDQLAEQIKAIQPAAAPDLNPIQTRLDDLAAAIIDTGKQDGEDPVATQLVEISALLNADRENDFDVARVTALLEKLESAFDRGEEPDFVALQDRMAKLNETLENAAELASLEDISDLRSEIATLRRELRSLPTASDEDSEITPVLKDLAERIDKLSSQTPATRSDLEDQMGRIQLAIEQSAGQGTAIGQISETLTTIQATLDDTVRYGGLATEEALGDGQGANLLMQLGRALREDLGALRSEAAQAERRTQDSINALGGALAGVTGRMAVLETDTAPLSMQPGEPAVAPQQPATAAAFEPDPSEFAAPDLAETPIPAAEASQTDVAETMAGEVEIAASPMFDAEPAPAAWSGSEAAAYDEPQAPEPEPKPAMTAPVLETDEDDAPVTSSIEQDVAAQQTTVQQQRSETASLIAAIRGIEPQRTSDADANHPAEIMAETMAGTVAETVVVAEPSEFEPEAAPDMTEPETSAPETSAPETSAPGTVAGHEPAAEFEIGAATLSGSMPDPAFESMSDAGAGQPGLSGTLDVTPQPHDAIAEPQPAEPAETRSTGNQGFLGRLTSSQLLKRATGGKSESFTPDLEENDDPDALLEPGTDGPMMSELDGAPSSDTAVMSGERLDDAAFGQADAAGIADSPAGTGFVLTDEAGGGDKVNDFLAAARRAARAAVIEAAEAERYAEEHKPANPLSRIMSAVSAHRKMILAGAVVVAVAFAAWQFLQSRDGVVVPQMAQIPQDASQATPQEAAAPETPAMAPETPAMAPETPAMAPEAPAMAPADAASDAGTGTAQAPAGMENAPAAAEPTSEVTFADPSVQPGQFRSREAGTASQPSGLTPPSASAPAAMPASPDIDALRVAAEAGVRDSQFSAGLAYADGLGVEQDYVEAYKWFELAARAGDPQASARRDALAKVMTPVDLDMAAAALAAFDPAANAASTPTATVEEPAAPSIDLSLIPAAIGTDALRVAAITGNHQAEFEVATRYADGMGVEQDLELAVFWYARAAEGRLAPAQYRLASMYEKGTGVRGNPRTAQDWYQRAAEAGNAKAMHNLAVLFAEGAAGKPDLTAAATWFRKAAEHGVRDSQFNAGILYARGLGVKQDYAEAFKWFAVAAHSGDEQAKARREAIAQAMSSEHLAEARAAVEAFKPAPLDPAANVVPPPAVEWGEPAAAGEPGKLSLESSDLIQLAQTQLTRIGFDPGPADGRFGPKTRQAVKAFQAAAGLEVNGKIDAALVEMLKSRRI